MFRLLKYFERYKAKKLFPKKIHDYWAAGCAGWNEKNKDEVFPYWIQGPDGENEYNNVELYSVVPVYVRKEWVAFYHVVSWSKQPFYDGAAWDDGRKYELKFCRVEKNNKRHAPYHRN